MYSIEMLNRCRSSVKDISLVEASKLMHQVHDLVIEDDIAPVDITVAIRDGLTELPTNSGDKLDIQGITAALCSMINSISYKAWKTISGRIIYRGITGPRHMEWEQIGAALEIMADFSEKPYDGIILVGTYYSSLDEYEANTHWEQVGYTWTWEDIRENRPPEGWCDFQGQTEENFWELVEETMGAECFTDEEEDC